VRPLADKGVVGRRSRTFDGEACKLDGASLSLGVVNAVPVTTRCAGSSQRAANASLFNATGQVTGVTVNPQDKSLRPRI